jgi:hypothetical protein
MRRLAVDSNAPMKASERAGRSPANIHRTLSFLPWVGNAPTVKANYFLQVIVNTQLRGIGGESGIRSLGHPLDSVTYRFHIARIAENAGVAVGPCPFLPLLRADLADGDQRHRGSHREED